MCNDVTIRDGDYEQKVLRSCKNINEKRKNDSDLDKELIDCSLVSWLNVMLVYGFCIIFYLINYFFLNTDMYNKIKLK